jgi:hypothetical protein
LKNDFEVQKSTLPEGLAFERHFTIKQIAGLWALSEDVVRRLFENDPDIVRVGHDEQLHLRRHWTFTIPESVVRRIHRRITQVGGKPV